MAITIDVKNLFKMDFSDPEPLIKVQKFLQYLSKEHAKHGDHTNFNEFLNTVGVKVNKTIITLTDEAESLMVLVAE